MAIKLDDLAPEEALRDGSIELYDAVRAKIVESLYFWSKAICQYPDLTPRCHLPLCLFLQDESRRSKVVEYPRRHLKTTIVTISYSLWRFARAAILGDDLDERIALVSSTKDNARRFLRPIKQQVESNRLIHAFVPELIPDFGNEQTWNQDEITFPRQRVGISEPSIDTFGAGSKATSRHYDGIIEDDMINEENWDSADAIRKAIQLHQLAENLLEDADNSWRITNENSWAEYDLNAHIIKHESETAILSVGCTTKLNRNRSRHLPPIVEELARAWDAEEAIWPERFGRDALRRIREKMSALIYNAQYENQPFDPDVVDFKEEWLRYYEWGRDAKGRAYIRIPASGGQPIEIVPLSSLYICGAFDPAISEKTSADRSAIVVVGVDERERVFLLSVDALRADPLDVLQRLIERVIQWRVLAMGIETVLFQKLLFKLLLRLCDDWNAKHKGDERQQVSFGVFQELKPLKGRDKEGRIRFLVSTPFQEGRVYVHASQIDFTNEYMPFPRGATIDVLDAFAYSAMLWLRGFPQEEEEAAMRPPALPAMDPVTGY